MPGEKPNADDQILTLAFYLLVDVSYSMAGPPLDAVNKIIPEVMDALEASPTLADVVRVGAIDFADDSRSALRLGDLRDVKKIPQFRERGGTSYAAGFRELRKEIGKDVAQLKQDGYKVYRPAVFFLTDGAPTDDAATLQTAFAELTDEKFKFWPNIIPFGVAAATKTMLDPWVFPKAGDSKKPMRSYVYAGQGDAATAITQLAEILISSIMASAQSVGDGGQAGTFIPPDEDDLDDWI
jgi:uncharacterized protein YegL